MFPQLYFMLCEMNLDSISYLYRGVKDDFLDYLDDIGWKDYEAAGHINELLRLILNICVLYLIKGSGPNLGCPLIHIKLHMKSLDCKIKPLASL